MNSCIFKNLTYSNIWLSFILILPPNLTKPVLYCVSILIPFVVGETLQHILLKLLRAPLCLIIKSWLTEQDWPVSTFPTSARSMRKACEHPLHSLSPALGYLSLLAPSQIVWDPALLTPTSHPPFLLICYFLFGIVLFTLEFNRVSQSRRNS